MSEYTEMAYAELQKAAKEAGVNAKGTKDELIARLEGGVETAEVPEAPVAQPEAPAAPKAASEQEVEKEWNADQNKMKAHLDAQPKVSIMIPLEQGVPPEQAEKVPFTVNINGYRLSIKRGVFVAVPQQVAEMVKERLESEGQIGKSLRIDNDPAKVEALG